MVRTMRKLGMAITAVVLIAVAAILIQSSVTYAERDNEFPGISSGRDWTFNRQSPDPNLTWLYKANRPQETINGMTTHILRNRTIGRNEGTRLRVYFLKRPRTVSVKVNVIACELNAPKAFAGFVRVALGGRKVYERNTLPRNGGSSEVCRGDRTKLDGKTFSVGYRNNQQANYRCADPGGGRPINCDNDPEAEMGRDPKSGLYFADLDIDLDARNDAVDGGASSSMMQRITFNVVANNVRAANGSNAVPLMGYRFFTDENNAARFFGLQGNGGRNDDFPGYGQKLAIPFGMDCNDEHESITRNIRLYDPDIGGYGDVYMKVFRRNPETGNIILLDDDNGNRDPDDDNFIFNHKDGKTAWEERYKRVRSTAGSNQNSVFKIRMEKNMQYMLVIINPHNPSKQDPSPNVYSLFLPVDSINGLVSCQYNLEPRLSGVEPSFSYESTLHPHGTVTNTSSANNPTGDHEWRITRAVLDHVPADLSRGSHENSSKTPCDFMNSTSGPLEDCDAIFTGSYPDDDDTIVPDPVGPYPLGTHVCYITSVKDPTSNPSDDNKWRHSIMMCSITGKQPKAQILGHDLRVMGESNTSRDQVDSKTYGSWGEYGVLLNGCNIRNRTGSGASMNNGGAGTGIQLHRLTFANQPPAAPACSAGPAGTYGKFGGLTAYIADTYRNGGTFRDHRSVVTTGTSTVNINTHPQLPNTLDQSTPDAQRKQVFYYPRATVRISDDIAYSDTGYTSIGKIPRIIIIAKNIIIDRDVRRVDAWLIARTGGGPGPSGNISTCNLRQYSAGANNFSQNGAPLRANRCNRVLTFNGPVMANRIFLHRTGGSTALDIGAPAEIFNLRADVFLSSLSVNDNPVATTDVVTELPPRF